VLASLRAGGGPPAGCALRFPRDFLSHRILDQADT
jgi:hypothetical protein